MVESPQAGSTAATVMATGDAAGPSRESGAKPASQAALSPQKVSAFQMAVMAAKPARASVAALRDLPAAPVVLFTQSLACKMPSRSSSPQSKPSAYTSTYDVAAAQKVRRTLVLLCQLSPQLLEPTFAAVVKVFQSVRGGLQGAVQVKRGDGASTSADAEAATSAAAELSPSAIAQIGSAARVLLEVVATLRTLLTILQNYSRYAALVRSAAEAAQGAELADDGSLPAAERARVLSGMHIEEVDALEESKVALATFSEDVVAGHISRVHAEAHCQLLTHLKRLSESAEADITAEKALLAKKTEGVQLSASLPMPCYDSALLHAVLVG